MRYRVQHDNEWGWVVVKVEDASVVERFKTYDDAQHRASALEYHANLRETYKVGC